MANAEQDAASLLSRVVRVAETALFVVGLLAAVGLAAAGIAATYVSFQPTPAKQQLSVITGKVEKAGPELARYQRREKTGPVERIEENRIGLRLTDGSSRIFAVPPSKLAPHMLPGLIGHEVSVRTFYGDVWSIDSEGRELVAYAKSAAEHEAARPYIRIYGPLSIPAALAGGWLVVRARRAAGRRRRALLGN